MLAFHRSVQRIVKHRLHAFEHAFAVCAGVPNGESKAVGVKIFGGGNFNQPYAKGKFAGPISGKFNFVDPSLLGHQNRSVVSITIMSFKLRISTFLRVS